MDILFIWLKLDLPMRLLMLCWVKWSSFETCYSCGLHTSVRELKIQVAFNNWLRLHFIVIIFSWRAQLRALFRHFCRSFFTFLSHWLFMFCTLRSRFSQCHRAWGVEIRLRIFLLKWLLKLSFILIWKITIQVFWQLKRQILFWFFLIGSCSHCHIFWLNFWFI